MDLRPKRSSYGIHLSGRYQCNVNRDHKFNEPNENGGCPICGSFDWGDKNAYFAEVKKRANEVRRFKAQKAQALRGR